LAKIKVVIGFPGSLCTENPPNVSEEYRACSILSALEPKKDYPSYPHRKRLMVLLCLKMQTLYDAALRPFWK
jgi:hypothetical protein